MGPGVQIAQRHRGAATVVLGGGRDHAAQVPHQEYFGPEGDAGQLRGNRPSPDSCRFNLEVLLQEHVKQDPLPQRRRALAWPRPVFARVAAPPAGRARGTVVRPPDASKPTVGIALPLYIGYLPAASCPLAHS